MQKPAVPVSLLIWCLAVAIWLAWSPFEIQTTGPSEYTLTPAIDLEFFGHLVLLAPLAAVLAVTAHARGWTRPVLDPWALTTGLAILLEAGQWWIEGRTVAPHDIVMGSLGAAVAIGGTRLVLRKGMRHTTALIAVGLATFIAVAGVVALGGSFPERGDFHLAGWEPRFEVLAGEETDGSRGYEGVIREARICAGTPPQELCIGPGADDAQREAVVRRAHETQRVTVSARVTSRSSSQEGPARIVTFSDGTSHRNVTLAQAGTDLVFRVRTPWTGPNGSRPQFVLTDAVPEGVSTRVEAEFSEGNVTLAAEGEGGRIRGVFPDPSSGPRLEAQQSDEESGLAFLLPRGALVGAGLVFAGLGVGTAWWLRTRRRIRWIAGPCAAAAGLSIHDYLVLGQSVPALGDLAFAAAGALVGVVLAVLDQGWRR